MNWSVVGDKFSKRLTNIVRGARSRKIVVIDKHNTSLFHFPVLFFVVIILFLPVVVGVLIFFFLLSEYHVVMKGKES